MRTTLHNHRFIDSEEKPIIPNAEFKELVKAAVTVFELQFKYSLTPQQKFIVTDIMDQNSINKKLNHPKLFND